MESYLTPTNILFVLGLLGTLFSVYNYFRNPQIKSETADALIEQKLKYINEANDTRFKTMQDSISSITAQTQNHIHTIDTKVDTLVKSMNETNIRVAKLTTIIDERIPKRKTR